jgi:CRP-like cAMP-binding protein
MRRKGSAAVAVVRPEEAPAGAVEALRRRLAGSTAREHVVLDFLEDDLREAREALAAVVAYVDDVEAVLSDPSAPQDTLLALALGGGPLERVDALSEVLASVRRRIAQVAARM